MSLLDSIFGGEVPKSKEVSTLFEKPNDFSVSKKSLDDNNNNNNNNNNKNKNKKKKRSFESSNKADGEEEEEEEDKDDTTIDKKKRKTSSKNKKKKQKESESSSSSESDSESSAEEEEEQQQQLEGDDAPKDRMDVVNNNVTNNDKKKKNRSSSEAEEIPAEAATANENDKDDDRDLEDRTVFVGNLPCSVTRKGLEKLFRECGPISSTRIRSVATTGLKVPQEHAGNQKMVKKIAANIGEVNAGAKPCVVGYVVFKKNDDPNGIQGYIEKALRLNNTVVEDPSKVSGSRRIRVDHAKSEYDATRSIFVGNLPYQTDEETLRRHFGTGCSLTDEDIEGVRVVRDKESYQCKGFAYILFRDKSMVATALRSMHGSKYMKKELRVLVCKRRYNSNTTDSGRHKHKTSQQQEAALKPGVAALRRIFNREKAAEKPKKRMRGKKKIDKVAHTSGKSKRAAAEAKTNKRVKKLEKRISKGMGKSKKG